MLKSEIDEISGAFQEAWDDYFGDTCYLIRLNRAESVFNPLYRECKNLVYDYDKKIKFTATVKEIELDDVTQPFGSARTNLFILTVVTKQLEDVGIYEIDHNDLITYTTTQGDLLVTRKFHIYDTITKVQFNASKIFTKIQVKEEVAEREVVKIPKDPSTPLVPLEPAKPIEGGGVVK